MRSTDAETASRVRRLTIWTLPVFLLLFAVLAIKDIRHGDWFGAVYAIASCFVLLAAL